MADTVLEKRNKILRFFPVPRYLVLGATACSIDGDVLRFIELAPRGKNMIVRQWGEKNLPSVIEDDADEIPAEVKKAVEKIVVEAKMRSVSIILPERLAYDFSIDIPIVEEHLIRGALAFKLEEHIPIPPAEVIFEYNIVGRDAGTRMMTLAVRAVAQKHIDRYVGLFSSLGILVAGCETESKSALLSMISPDDAVHRLVIQIGKVGTAIFIARGSSVLFSSSLPFGSESITGIDEKSLTALESIRDEAKKVIGYWDTRPESKAANQVQSVLLFGSAAAHTGVKEYFESALSHTAKLANVWRNAFSLDEILPEIDAARAQDFASVIGLSLLQ